MDAGKEVSFLPVIQSGTSAHGMVLPAVRIGLSSSCRPFRKHLTHVLRGFVANMILNPVKQRKLAITGHDVCMRRIPHKPRHLYAWSTIDGTGWEA